MNKRQSAGLLFFITSMVLIPDVAEEQYIYAIIILIISAIIFLSGIDEIYTPANRQ